MDVEIQFCHQISIEMGAFADIMFMSDVILLQF